MESGCSGTSRRDRWWSSLADVIGTLVPPKLWDLLEGKLLFSAYGENKNEEYSDQKQLARITALIGPPPPQFLTRGKRSPLFYDSRGM
jgi:serine/threonine-protein kinase SRPK3